MYITALIPAFFNLGTGEVLLIVLIILLLFGGKRIPELMRGLGKGVRSFRQGMNEISDEINHPGSTSGHASRADKDGEDSPQSPRH